VTKSLCNNRHFKPGDHTANVWSGDIVTDCEFIRPLDDGAMLFYDHTFRCFRRVFWTVLPDVGVYDGSFILNGWKCSDKPFRS
jgi:hypothetical protein